MWDLASETLTFLNLVTDTCPEGVFFAVAVAEVDFLVVFFALVTVAFDMVFVPFDDFVSIFLMVISLDFIDDARY